jgi:hypothetical protein
MTIVALPCGTVTIRFTWRAFDYDRARGPIRGYPGGGGYAGDLYEVAYAKAMLQAALLMEKS